jgi:hypothetical protein
MCPGELNADSFDVQITVRGEVVAGDQSNFRSCLQNIQLLSQYPI